MVERQRGEQNRELLEQQQIMIWKLFIMLSQKHKELLPKPNQHEKVNIMQLTQLLLDMQKLYTLYRKQYVLAEYYQII